MKLWIDADACPGSVKEIVIRAANRLAVPVIFVANKPIRVPLSPYVSTRQVAHGLDVADGFIVSSASTGDLAVTADIPLAAALVEKGVVTLDLRGQLFSSETIGEVLAMRNFMHDLREGGVETGGPRGFGARDAQQFAATLDRELTRLSRLSSRRE